ncbi:hypothetical protein [Phocaeicola sp.]|nr:hypothetical protein [Bacteroides sp.]
MGFDKFIERITVIDTAVFTIFMVIIGGTVFHALGFLISIPVIGLAVLAIHEMTSDGYRCMKDAMEQRKRQPYYNDKFEDDWKQMLKDARTRYISSIILAIIWNICVYIVVTMNLLIKLDIYI